jgi:hypothetical protein
MAYTVRAKNAYTQAQQKHVTQIGPNLARLDSALQVQQELNIS